MTFWDNLALAFKGGGGGHAQYPPLSGRFITGAMGGVSPFAEAPFSYLAATRAAYMENPVAQRAVRIVSEGVGSAPIIASDEKLQRLIAETSAGQSLVETLAAYLLLHGNAYVQILTDDNMDPVELFALRPDRVSVESDENGWPTAYRYRAGEAETRLPLCDALGRPAIIHIKSFHPTDDHYGLGCLGAAAPAVAVHNAAARWNQALLENAARPSGALVYDPGDAGALSTEQFDRLKNEMETAFAGAANAGRPMLLEGGLKWQAMSLTPADMDFVALKAAAAREIALAFGVPPMLLGLPGDNNYANYKEANRALWRLTILPLAAKIFGALGEALASWTSAAKISVNLDRVSALSEDRERLWAQVSAADFLSREEKRAMLGLDQ